MIKYQAEYQASVLMQQCKNMPKFQIPSRNDAYQVFPAQYYHLTLQKKTENDEKFITFIQKSSIVSYEVKN